MRITETKERECCEKEDLAPYHGIVHADFKGCGKGASAPMFCKHCGQCWKWQWEADPSDPDGGSYVRVKVAIR